MRRARGDGEGFTEGGFASVTVKGEQELGMGGLSPSGESQGQAPEPVTQSPAPPSVSTLPRHGSPRWQALLRLETALRSPVRGGDVETGFQCQSSFTHLPATWYPVPDAVFSPQLLLPRR